MSFLAAADHLLASNPSAPPRITPPLWASSIALPLVSPVPLYGDCAPFQAQTQLLPTAGARVLASQSQLTDASEAARKLAALEVKIGILEAEKMALQKALRQEKDKNHHQEARAVLQADERKRDMSATYTDINVEDGEDIMDAVKQTRLNVVAAMFRFVREHRSYKRYSQKSIKIALLHNILRDVGLHSLVMSFPDIQHMKQGECAWVVCHE